jgi:hypothetical protein
MVNALEETLLLVDVILLAARLPLSVVAVLGYRGSPWGHVLLPFPFITGGYLVTQGLTLSHLEGPASFWTGLGTLVVAVAATALLAVRLHLLLTERREI